MPIIITDLQYRVEQQHQVFDLMDGRREYVQAAMPMLNIDVRLVLYGDLPLDFVPARFAERLQAALNDIAGAPPDPAHIPPSVASQMRFRRIAES